VPEISRFYGIVIRMRSREHPPPHFHAYYGGANAAVDIRSLGLVGGDRLPPRIVGLIVEWAALHERELLVNWERIMNGLPANRIAPLA
jgi:hypothetical protein